MAQTTTATGADGILVVIKRGRSRPEIAGLAREAELLGHARHPGIVELVGLDNGPDGAAVTLAHVPGPSLAEVGHVGHDVAAGLVAATATIVADLHDLGWVHGAVAPDHVLLSPPHGHPVLCGFGHAGRIGSAVPFSPPRDARFLDPARHGAEPLDPSVDVFGLGVLLSALTEGAGVLEPERDHVLNAQARSVIAAVVRDATDDEPIRRPSARDIATALHDGLPQARLPGPTDLAAMCSSAAAGGDGAGEDHAASDGHTGGGRGVDGVSVKAPATEEPPDPLAGLRTQRANRHRRHRTNRPALARAARFGSGVATAALIVAGIAFMTARPPQRLVAPPGSPVTAADQVTSTVARPPPTCPMISTELRADVDSDGCLDALRWDSGILTAGDTRWSVGSGDDQVATGDWACDGRRTLAVLRPSSGQVFRFDGWPTAGPDLSAPAVAVVDGAVALRAAPRADHPGCDSLVVDRRDRPPVTISPGPVR